MNQSLRIAVADDEVDMSDFFQDILPTLGHQVVSVAVTGRELVQQCLSQEPDLVITDIKMPDMDGLDAAEEICRHKPVPFILVSAHDDAELVEKARRGCDHILAYLMKPVKTADLKLAITLATDRHEHFQALQQEASDLRQALDDRKLIERAKGILMNRGGWDENTAFRKMQKLARSKSRKLAEIARTIIEAEAVHDE